MEHAKKYVLVDPQMYRPSLPEKSLSGLDLEIQTILKNELPDDQKAKMYSLALKKYKAYDNSTKIPEPKPMIDPTEALPPNQQYKAKKLWRLIKDNPDIDWSDKGELIYKQSLIPDSHVSDLFGDVLSTKRPAEGATGWEEFDDVLDSSKVPTALAKRKAVKRLSKKTKRQGEPTWEIPDSSDDSKRRKAKKKQTWIKS
jgi:hypothetical protein